MALEDIDDQFLNTNTSDEAIDEQLQEEIEDLLDSKTRKEVLEELHVLSPEVRERAEEILEQVIFQNYRKEIKSDQEFEDQLENTVESVRNLSEERKENVLKALSPSFRKTVEELIED
ncbi:MAG: hypothetical protein ACI83Q_000118 [Colwellia polaris]|jgi:hypothetical protein